MRGRGVDGAWKSGVDVGVVGEVGAGGVLGDVETLGFEVGEVADAVFKAGGMPDFVVAVGGVGVAAFDELDGSRCADVCGGREEDVDVVGHDGVGVEEELALRAVALEGCEEEFSAGCALEVAMPAECGDRQSVGVDGLAGGGIGRSLRRYWQRFVPH